MVDTLNLLEKTGMNKLNEIMAKFNKISKYSDPGVAQPLGNDIFKANNLWV